MAEEMKGTNISSPVVPFTKDDRYATHDETFGRGGYRSVASISEMNAIPNERRKEGMLVNVVGDKIYRLVNGSFVAAFKTINGQSILGSGNIPISGGSGSDTHDLTIDVKAGADGIYYRIKEVVPNGYIHFVRKKKKKYYSISQTKEFSQTTYSPMGLSYDRIKSGVDVSTLTPNVWYKYPITDEALVNTYTAGSNNPEGIIVTYNMFKFSGNTHAKPIFFIPNGGTIGSKRTTVLNAGLQYNVLETSFMEKKSAKIMFRQRGDIRKIDVRLSVNNINTFASGYKLVYAIK